MDSRRLEGRVALVFGAGSVGPGWGNGKATAVQYARDGAKVIAVDISEDAARETVEIITSEGNVAWSDVCDVTSASQIDALVSRVEARAGRIDILHNNVGLTAMGVPFLAYSTSKAAVNQLTVGIAIEHASRGIRANVIMPGLMDTPHIYAGIAGQYESAEDMVRQRAALCPMGRMGTGWDIAKAAAFLASDDAQYITGVCLPVDGGITCRI